MNNLYATVDKDRSARSNTGRVTTTVTTERDEWTNKCTYPARHGEEMRETTTAFVHNLNEQPVYEPIDDTDSERDPLYSRVCC